MNTEAFDHTGFWTKARRMAGRVPFVKDAAAMYFAMLDPKTPLAAKTAIAGALVYFIVPFDAIPDLMGPMGFADDAAAVSGALAFVGANVTKTHYEEAEKMFE